MNRIGAIPRLKTAARQLAGVSATVAREAYHARRDGATRLAPLPFLLPESGSNEFLGQPLTRRERQILKLVAVGQPYSAIAIELGLTTKTVDRHVQHIHRKIGAHCVAHLVHYAIAKGEVEVLCETFA